MTRVFLKQCRVMQDMTQAAAAAAIGCNRQYYANVENCKTTGTFQFWQGVQNAFELSDGDTWRAIKTMTK